MKSELLLHAHHQQDKQPQLQIGFASEREVNQLINSGRFWILIGDHPVFGDLEEHFQDGDRRSFITVMGPVPDALSEVFGLPTAIACVEVMHFICKDTVSARELQAFFDSHPDCSLGLRVTEGRDIFFMLG